MPPKYSHVTPPEEQAMSNSVLDTEETPFLERNPVFREFAKQQSRVLPSQHQHQQEELQSSLEDNAKIEQEHKQSPYNRNSARPTVIGSSALSNLAGLERTMESKQTDRNNIHNIMYDHNSNTSKNNKSVSNILSSRVKLNASPSIDASGTERTITSHEFTSMHSREGITTPIIGNAEHYHTKTNNKRRVIHATLAPRLASSEESLVSKDIIQHSVAQYTNTPVTKQAEPTYSNPDNVNGNSNDVVEERNRSSTETSNKQVAEISDALRNAASTQNVNSENRHVLEVVESSHEPNHLHHRHHHNRHTRGNAQEFERFHNEQPHHSHIMQTHHEPLVSKENHFVNPVLLLTTGAELDNISWADNSIANEAKIHERNTLTNNNANNIMKNKKENKETLSPHTTNTLHKNVNPSSSSSTAAAGHLSPLSHLHKGREEEQMEHHHFHNDSDDRINPSRNNNNDKREQHTSFLIATDEAVHNTYNSDNTQETKGNIQPTSQSHPLSEMHDSKDVSNPITATLPHSMHTSLPELPLPASSAPHILSSKLLHTAEEQHTPETSSSLSSHRSEHNRQPEWMKTAQSPHHRVALPVMATNSNSNTQSPPMETEGITKWWQLQQLQKEELEERKRRQKEKRGRHSKRAHQIHASLPTQQHLSSKSSSSSHYSSPSSTTEEVSYSSSTSTYAFSSPSRSDMARDSTPEAERNSHHLHGTNYGHSENKSSRVYSPRSPTVPRWMAMSTTPSSRIIENNDTFDFGDSHHVAHAANPLNIWNHETGFIKHYFAPAVGNSHRSNNAMLNDAVLRPVGRTLQAGNRYVANFPTNLRNTLFATEATAKPLHAYSATLTSGYSDRGHEQPQLKNSSSSITFSHHSQQEHHHHHNHRSYSNNNNSARHIINVPHSKINKDMEPMTNDNRSKQSEEKLEKNHNAWQASDREHPSHQHHHKHRHHHKAAIRKDKFNSANSEMGNYGFDMANKGDFTLAGGLGGGGDGGGGGNDYKTIPLNDNSSSSSINSSSSSSDSSGSDSDHDKDEDDTSTDSSTELREKELWKEELEADKLALTKGTRTYRTRNMNALHAFSWDQRIYLPTTRGIFYQPFRLFCSPRFWEKLDWTVRASLFCILPTLILCLEPRTSSIFPLPTSVVALAFWISMPTLGGGLRELFIVLKGFTLSFAVMVIIITINPKSSWLTLLLFFVSMLIVSFVAEETRRITAFTMATLFLQYILSPQETNYQYVVKYFLTLLIALGFGLAAFFVPYIRWSSDIARHYIGVLGDTISLSARGMCAGFWARSPLERQLHVSRLRQLRSTIVQSLARVSTALSEMGYEPHSGTYTAQLKTRMTFMKNVSSLLQSMSLVIEQIAENPEIIDTPLCNAFGVRILPELSKIGAMMDITIVKIGNLEELITSEDIELFKLASASYQDAISRVREEIVLSNVNYKADHSDILLGFFLFCTEELCDAIGNFHEDPHPPSNTLHFLTFPIRDVKSLIKAWQDLYHAIWHRHTITRRLKEAIKLSLAMIVAAIFQVYGLRNQSASPVAGVDIIALVYNRTGAQSFQYANHRLLGTVLGSLTGLLSVQTANQRRWVLYIFVALISFIGAYVQAAPGFYPLGNAICNSVISIAIQYTDQNAAMTRIQQNCFAILMYFLVASLIWPMRGHTKVKLGLDISLRMFREGVLRLFYNLDMPEDAGEVSADVNSLITEMNKRIGVQLTHLPGAIVEPTMDSAEFPEMPWRMLIGAQQKLLATLTTMTSAYHGFMSSTIGDGDAMKNLSVHWVILHRIAPYTHELSNLIYAAVDLYLLSLTKAPIVPTAHLTSLREGMLRCRHKIIQTYIETLQREVIGDEADENDNLYKLRDQSERSSSNTSTITTTFTNSSVNEPKGTPNLTKRTISSSGKVRDQNTKANIHQVQGNDHNTASTCLGEVDEVHTSTSSHPPPSFEQPLPADTSQVSESLFAPPRTVLGQTQYAPLTINITNNNLANNQTSKGISTLEHKHSNNNQQQHQHHEHQSKEIRPPTPTTNKNDVNLTKNNSIVSKASSHDHSSSLRGSLQRHVRKGAMLGYKLNREEEEALREYINTGSATRTSEVLTNASIIHPTIGFTSLDQVAHIKKDKKNKAGEEGNGEAELDNNMSIIHNSTSRNGNEAAVANEINLRAQAMDELKHSFIPHNLHDLAPPSVPLVNPILPLAQALVVATTEANTTPVDKTKAAGVTNKTITSSDTHLAPTNNAENVREEEHQEQQHQQSNKQQKQQEEKWQERQANRNEKITNNVLSEDNNKNENIKRDEAVDTIHAKDDNSALPVIDTTISNMKETQEVQNLLDKPLVIKSKDELVQNLDKVEKNLTELQDTNKTETKVVATKVESPATENKKATSTVHNESNPVNNLNNILPNILNGTFNNSTIRNLLLEHPTPQSAVVPVTLNSTGATAAAALQATATNTLNTLSSKTAMVPIAAAGDDLFNVARPVRVSNVATTGNAEGSLIGRGQTLDNSSIITISGQGGMNSAAIPIHAVISGEEMMRYLASADHNIHKERTTEPKLHEEPQATGPAPTAQEQIVKKVKTHEPHLVDVHYTNHPDTENVIDNNSRIVNVNTPLVISPNLTNNNNNNININNINNANNNVNNISNLNINYDNGDNNNINNINAAETNKSITNNSIGGVVNSSLGLRNQVLQNTAVLLNLVSGNTMLGTNPNSNDTNGNNGIAPNAINNNNNSFIPRVQNPFFNFSMLSSPESLHAQEQPMQEFVNNVDITNVVDTPVITNVTTTSTSTTNNTALQYNAFDRNNLQVDHPLYTDRQYDNPMTTMEVNEVNNSQSPDINTSVIWNENVSSASQKAQHTENEHAVNTLLPSIQCQVGDTMRGNVGNTGSVYENFDTGQVEPFTTHMTSPLSTPHTTETITETLLPQSQQVEEIANEPLMLTPNQDADVQIIEPDSQVVEDINNEPVEQASNVNYTIQVEEVNSNSDHNIENNNNNDKTKLYVQESSTDIEDDLAEALSMTARLAAQQRKEEANLAPTKDADQLLEEASFFDEVEGVFILTNRDIHSLEAFLFGIRSLISQLDQLEQHLLEMLHDNEIARKL